MESKINVCLMNDSFPPQIDGVANVVMNYAGIITRDYGSATVVTPYCPGAEDDYPYRVVRYPSIATSLGYRAGLTLTPKEIRELAQKNFDVIHTHCPIVSTFHARALRELTGKPVIFTYHTKFDVDIKNAIDLGFLQKAAIRAIVANIEACDEVWTVSRGAGENLRSLGFTGKYEVVENGVDFPKGKASPDAVDAVSREYSLPDGVPLFLFVGRMMWYKGLRTILEGLSIAKRNGCVFRMIFAGGGGDEAEARVLCDELGLSAECVFTGMVKDREKLRSLFSRADMFLFPSTFDTNGIVVREAAACGLGSVLIRGSCAAEGMTDGRNAILIDDTPQSLAEAVEGICGGRIPAAMIGQRAMEELYRSWDEAVAEAVERYRESAERGARRTRPVTRLEEMAEERKAVLESEWGVAMRKLREYSKK